MTTHKIENTLNKILIVVYGGVVQNVYSSNPEIHIELLDYDNLEIQDQEKDKKEFELRTKNMVSVSY